MLKRSLAAALVLMAMESWCCCCGDWLDLPEIAKPEDEPEIERVAREYAQRNAPSLLSSTDGGTSSGECRPSGGAVALELGAAVLSRGHAGSEAAAQARFDLTACARQLVIALVKRAAVWIVVGAYVYDLTSGTLITQTGEGIELVPAEDVDGLSDEIF